MAARYARAQHVRWRTALVFAVPGTLRLSRHRALLNYLYAGIIILVAIYMLYQSAQALGFRPFG